MTPRRRLHCARTVITGGLAAVTLVGCSNGVHVAGPTTPQETVISGAASPSADAGSARPKGHPTSAPQTADPTAESTASKKDGGTGGSGTGTNNSGAENGATQKDKHGKHHKNRKRSGDQGIGDPSSTTTSKEPTPHQSASASADSRDGSDSTDDSASSGSGNGNDSTSSTCQLNDLAVSARVPAGSGAAGSQYVLITFTNKSGAPCSMYGYAGVSFVGNQDGTQLGKPARRAKSVAASHVTLADGDTETELLKIADAGVWDAKECVPTTSDGFRIYPPSSYTSAYVKFATTACQSKSVRQLTVFPIGTKS